MTKKHTVMLPPGPTKSAFRRTVRKDGQPVLDDAGNPRVLVFNPGQGVELTAEELESVSDDIGNVLHIAKAVEGKPVVKPDSKATESFVKDRDEKKAKAAQAAAAESSEAGKSKPATRHTEPVRASSTGHSSSGKDLEHKAK
jgi:hypothetical protein